MFKCWSFTYDNFHQLNSHKLEFLYTISTGGTLAGQYPNLPKLEKQIMFYKYITRDILIELKNNGTNTLSIDPFSTTFYLKHDELNSSGACNFYVYKTVCHDKTTLMNISAFRIWTLEHYNAIIELLKEETMETIKLVAEELKDA
jgi:hypothetical protein